MRAGLAGAFGQAIEAAPTSELEAVGFQNAAEDRLAQALGVPFSSANLHDARHRRDEARDTHQLLNIELAELGLRLEEHRRLATMIGAQLPEAFAERARGANPVCPICHVAIDRVLAQGCSISRMTCDLEALQAKIDKLREDLQNERAEIRRLEERKPSLQTQIAIVGQRLASMDQTVRTKARRV